MGSLHEIVGKQLGCHCEPGNCHGEVLMALAKSQGAIPRSKPVDHVSAKSFSQPQQSPSSEQANFSSRYTTQSTAKQSQPSTSGFDNSNNIPPRYNHSPASAPPKQSFEHQGTPVTAQEVSHQNPWNQVHYPRRMQDEPAQPQQKKIAIFMDSNRRHIDFHSLFPNDKVTVCPSGTVHQAKGNCGRLGLKDPTDIILHVGTNDIETESPKQVAEQVTQFAVELEERFRCNIHVSLLPPRTDDLATSVIHTNRLISEDLKGRQTSPYGISVVSYPRLRAEDHLHDRKHLAMRKPTPGACSGVQELAAGLHRSVRGSQPSYSLLYKAQTNGRFDRYDTGPGR